MLTACNAYVKMEGGLDGVDIWVAGLNRARILVGVTLAGSIGDISPGDIKSGDRQDIGPGDPPILYLVFSSYMPIHDSYPTVRRYSPPTP